MTKHPSRRSRHEFELKGRRAIRGPDPHPRIRKLLRREGVGKRALVLRLVDLEIVEADVAKLLPVRKHLYGPELIGERLVEDRHEHAVVKIAKIEPRPEADQRVVMRVVNSDRGNRIHADRAAASDAD